MVTPRSSHTSRPPSLLAEGTLGVTLLELMIVIAMIGILSAVATSRRLIFAKGTDSHDYKFSSAALEDFHHITPAWRNRFLAASIYWLKGSGGADAPVMQRTRAAFA